MLKANSLELDDLVSIHGHLQTHHRPTIMQEVVCGGVVRQ
jgi:hypothetical protein